MEPKTKNTLLFIICIIDICINLAIILFSRNISEMNARVALIALFCFSMGAYAYGSKNEDEVKS